MGSGSAAGVSSADLELAATVVSKPARRPVAGRLAVRIAALGATAFGLYVIWPALMEIFAAIPQLRTLSPWWFPVGLVAEIGSFACLWILIGLCLHRRDRFVVITSQLAGNTIGRVLPGGAATGGALQLRMLVIGGIDTARATTGLATASLLSTALLFGMPVLSIPVLLRGGGVDAGLQQAAMIGAGTFVLMVAAGVVMLVTDRPLVLIGRFAQRLIALATRKPFAGDLPHKLIRERDLVKSTLDRNRWVALATAAGKSLLEYATLLAALAAVGATPRPGLVVLAYAASAVLAMIPITPGGLGFVEAGLTATLTLAGVSAGDAVLASLAFRLVSYWLPLPVGAGALYLFRRRFGKV